MVITNNMNNRTTQGRKKIEIKKIEQTPNLHVTFSKRRAGLFKKASELCILSGSEVAIIVRSPGNRVFAFGHPNADSVIERYLTGNADSGGPITNLSPMQEFNQHYSEVSKELEVEKMKRSMIEESKMVNNGAGFWWDLPVDEIGYDDLEPYMSALEELKKKVAIRADELMGMKSSAWNPSSASSSMFLLNPTVDYSDHLMNNQIEDYRTVRVPHGFGFGRGHS